VTALADLYRDLHRNPELSFAETRTAGIGAAWLREAGFETTEGVGGTGVVGDAAQRAGADGAAAGGHCARTSRYDPAPPTRPCRPAPAPGPVSASTWCPPSPGPGA